MKSFLELAKSRRSVRQYRNEKIPRKQIEKIIEAGLWAPSAMNIQPIKFFVIDTCIDMAYNCMQKEYNICL